MASHKKAATTERQIWIFGNPDRSKEGFESPGDLTDYISGDIFTEEDGRYRYTLARHADVIVLSRDGKLYGHLDVDHKETPNELDHKRYEKVRFVYVVRKSTLYATPVHISNFSIKKMQYGYRMNEAEFERLQQLVGGIHEFYGPKALPQSTVELEKTLQEVRRRLGQTDFRQRLMEAYNSRCAVSGCDAMEALEAAHIEPYSGAESNHASNGLLLRADIHTLFDLDLIGIDPTAFTVALASVLKRSCYSGLQGKPLALPTAAPARPNAMALAERWKRFSKKSTGYVE